MARALHTVARSGRTIACVLHQPSSQLFNTADDVIVLANGKTLYAGAIADVPETLAKAGFNCPQYYNIADYCKYGNNKFLQINYVLQFCIFYPELHTNHD